MLIKCLPYRHVSDAILNANRARGRGWLTVHRVGDLKRMGNAFRTVLQTTIRTPRFHQRATAVMANACAAWVQPMPIAHHAEISSFTTALRRGIKIQW